LEFSVTDLKWDHWHIEVSSICPLKCPRCPRQEYPETLKNTQLSLDFFRNQIGQEVIKNIKKITFCGNDGDPIYCKDFLSIVNFLKQINPCLSIVIITNGSYKDSDFWVDLGNSLNCYDEIHWSIDGVDDAMNQKYRINSNWESILNGIRSFKSVNTESYTIWAAIAFSFNENYIQDFIDIAKDLNFDEFQLTLSTKFDFKYPNQYKDDQLAPTFQSFVNTEDRYKRQTTVLSDKKRFTNLLIPIFIQRAKDLEKAPASGLCQIGTKGVFLNSKGEFYPCCWVANRYLHNKDWIKMAETKFNLHNQSFAEAIRDSFWKTNYLAFDSQECKTKCAKSKLNDLDYVSNW
jgi:MoaA/NifB/PqqE/SkfB family radical SAM enzyme